MKNSILATAAAVLCAGALTAAQNPGAPGQQSNPTQPRAGDQGDVRAGEQGNTTLTGCVYREESIPGRSPNIAERVGILEDYILVLSSAPGAPGSDSTVGTSGQAGANAPGARADGQPRADASPDRQDPGVAGTSGRAAAGGHTMFKLEHESDDTLQGLVGKRVEVMGKVDAEESDTTASGRPAADSSIGPDSIELPEFEVSSIREVSGQCPALPQTNFNDNTNRNENNNR